MSERKEGRREKALLSGKPNKKMREGERKRREGRKKDGKFSRPAASFFWNKEGKGEGESRLDIFLLLRGQWNIKGKPWRGRPERRKKKKEP